MENERQPSSPSRGERETPWRLILWAAVAVYAVIFLLLNADRQDVNFVFFTVKTRQIWLILISMALGAVLGSILPRWWRSRRKN